MPGLKLNHVSKRGHRRQAITCTNVDSYLCHHMESLGYNELGNPEGSGLNRRLPNCNKAQPNGNRLHNLTIYYIQKSILELTETNNLSSKSCHEIMIVVSSSLIKNYFISITPHRENFQCHPCYSDGLQLWYKHRFHCRLSTPTTRPQFTYRWRQNTLFPIKYAHLCLFCCGYIMASSWIGVVYVSIFFRVTAQYITRRQS